ncbi:hypothetical protein HX057_16915 [Myroides odoratimimus]|uniref:ABC-three component system protein n=1 Tax=Myroides odoratimimus TaxID=76832 RepID=UPI002576731A|nr:ABC-three component system protein [Myroides odoratimimus]MDM1448398.1 hypothetical protein [Myroides odoratimimus]
MNNQLIDPNDIHSAADTWSGFIYQGKVALYHVLKLISEKNSVNELHLQLDSIEDFAIIRYENNKIKPVSLHQVKAVKSHYYLKYKSEFEKLEKRKDDFPCDEEAYFHLATNNENSKAEIEAKHPKLKVYDYNGNPYCKIEDLQSLIKENIKSCLLKFNKEEFIHNDNYILNLSGELEDLITSQILAIHACNHSKNGLSISEGAYLFTIPLNNFIEKIQADQNELLFDKKFYQKRVRIDLNNYYQEFCLSFEDEINTREQREKLANYLIYLNGLNNNEFEIFLQKITPHKHIKYSNLDEYKRNTLIDDDFKLSFLYTLFTIRDSDSTDRNKIGWKDTNHKTYFPSTINTPNERINKRILSQDIIKISQEISVYPPDQAHIS